MATPTLRLYDLDLQPGDAFGFAYPPNLADPYPLGIAVGCIGWPGSTPIHAALVARRPWGYSPTLTIVEAVGHAHLPPDEPQGACGGVVATEATRRLWHHFTAHHGRLFHYRLVRPLDVGEEGCLEGFLDDALGKPFDWRGQFWARTMALGWLQQHFSPHRPDHFESFWCSKLLWSEWRAIGRVWGPAWVWAPGPLFRWAVDHGLTTVSEVIL
jgi:hypothetical protein